MENKSLNQSIIDIRVKLQNSKIKKTGYNKFSKFYYYELSDFLPKLNELMEEEKMNDVFTIKDDLAKLILIKGEETQEYAIPFVLFNTPQGMQDIQYLGALNTYYKRYLYLNAFGITDGDVIDSLDNSKLEKQENTELKIQKTQIEIIKKFYKDDNLDKLLKVNDIEKLEDMSVTKASEICKKIKMKTEEKKDGNN